MSSSLIGCLIHSALCHIESKGFVNYQWSPGVVHSVSPLFKQFYTWSISNIKHSNFIDIANDITILFSLSHSLSHSLSIYILIYIYIYIYIYICVCVCVCVCVRETTRLSRKNSVEAKLFCCFIIYIIRCFVILLLFFCWFVLSLCFPLGVGGYVFLFLYMCPGMFTLTVGEHN